MAKVNVPIFGQVNRGTVVGVGLGGTGLAAFLVYRQYKKSQAATTAAVATAQASSSYGYGAGSATPPGGYYGYGEPGNYYGYGQMGYSGYYGYGSPYPNPSPAAAVTTNAQWVQAAVNQLSNEGYDAQTVSGALGAYIAGAQVSASQVTIVQAAIGLEGYPPDPSSNGYPPQINTGGTPGGGSGGGQGGGTTTVPDLHNMSSQKAKATLTADGFIPKQANTVAPPGLVTSQSPAAGNQAQSGSTVTYTMKHGKPSIT